MRIDLFSRWKEAASWPTLFLALALSYVFIFGEHRGYFFWLVDWSTSMNMSVAANLSLDHGFLGFVKQFTGPWGEPEYVVYNRFPIGAAGLVKLAIAPFEGDLSAQIFAGKILTVLLFCASALLSYFSLQRIYFDRWTAAAATLMAFSSFNTLSFADTAVGEGVSFLFGVMLAFHGLAIFAREGRFGQLLAKTAAALLLSWQAAILVLVFVSLSVGAAAARRAAGAAAPSIARPVLYGVLSLIFSCFVLALNLAGEWRVLDWRGSIADLPSAESALKRIGILDTYGTWSLERIGETIELTIRRIGGASIPYAFFASGPEAVRNYIPEGPLPLREAGIVAAAICLASLFFIRHRIVVASLLSFAVVWAAAVPFTQHHAHEAVHVVGVSLIFYSVILKFIAHAVTDRVVSFSLFMFAATVFGVSNIEITRLAVTPEAGGTVFTQTVRDLGRGAARVEFHESTIHDFNAVRAAAPRGSSILIAERTGERTVVEISGTMAGIEFYLHGYVIDHGNREMHEDVEYRPNFILSRTRLDGPWLLTPGNRRVFLYDAAALCNAIAANARRDLKSALFDDKGVAVPCGS